MLVFDGEIEWQKSVHNVIDIWISLFLSLEAISYLNGVS